MYVVSFLRIRAGFIDKMPVLQTNTRQASSLRATISRRLYPATHSSSTNGGEAQDAAASLVLLDCLVEEAVDLCLHLRSEGAVGFGQLGLESLPKSGAGRLLIFQ